MVRPGNEVESSYPMSSDDDMGRVIRWGLKDMISGAEPPADVWPKVLGRVGDMPAPARPKRSFRPSPFPLAPFVQAVVVSALLLAFGLGVDRGVVLPRREYRLGSTPTVVQKARASDEFQEGMLRGYILARMEQRLPQRMGGEIREVSIPGQTSSMAPPEIWRGHVPP
jgi:hypothetical protein